MDIISSTQQYNLVGAEVHIINQWSQLETTFQSNINHFPDAVVYPRAVTTATTNTTQTQPTYLRFEDKATTLCWDAQTVAIGAQVYLRICNVESPTQNFLLVGGGVGAGFGGGMLKVAVNATMGYCVEVGTSLSLQKCNPLRVTQQFTSLTTDTPQLANSSTFFTTTMSPYKAVLPVTAKMSASKVTIKYSNVVMRVAVPRSIANIRLGGARNGYCFDGTNPAQVYAVNCTNSPSQQWYFQFGQLKQCSLHPPRPQQMWIKTAKNELQNAESANCIRTVLAANNMYLLKLGTDYCNQHNKDVLGITPLTGIESFFADLNVPVNRSCIPGTLRSRKDFRDLTPVQQSAFFNALNVLSHTPSLMGRRNRYHDYVAVHGMGAGWFHGSPLFLPWHRYFIEVLESDLRAINPLVEGHPYWDWDSDSKNWWLPSSGMMTPSRFGTLGTGKGPQQCVPDGFMSGWTPSDQNCLVRGYTSGSSSGTATKLFGEDYVLAIAQLDPSTGSPYTSFYNFAMAVESGSKPNTKTPQIFALNPSFRAVAGTNQVSQMGDPAVSVNDPLFWQHHVNIDRMYSYFQTFNPKLMNSYNGQIAYPPRSFSNIVKVSPKDIMPGFNVPVYYGMGYQVGPYCHRYVPYSGALKAGFSRLTSASRRKALNGRDSSFLDADILELMNAHTNIVSYIPDDGNTATLKPIKAAGVTTSTTKPSTHRIPKPRGHIPEPVPEWIHKKMNMNMTIAQLREYEAKVFNFLKQIQIYEDEAMKVFFGKIGFENGSFEEQATCVNYAVAKVVVQGRKGHP
ncbi:hypothetical protein HDU76_003016 [Blyttiomyces sp. JEL0837]|nr:hypothetical protein HDU76_003016 [Blyttiomyces sp. JEL0837]